MIELYTTKDMNELVELLDVVGNKTDSLGRTILVNTFFSRDNHTSRNGKGKIPALVPINATSTNNSRDYKGANCIDLFTMADPIFYEGGVFNNDFQRENKTDDYYELQDLEGKILFEKSKELGYDPKETMSNYISDWDSARPQYGNQNQRELQWTATSDNKSSKSGIYKLIQKHLNSVNQKYNAVMGGASTPQDIKSSYQRMTEF